MTDEISTNLLTGITNALGALGGALQSEKAKELVARVQEAGLNAIRNSANTLLSLSIGVAGTCVSFAVLCFSTEWCQTGCPQENNSFLCYLKMIVPIICTLAFTAFASITIGLCGHLAWSSKDKDTHDQKFKEIDQEFNRINTTLNFLQETIKKFLVPTTEPNT